MSVSKVGSRRDWQDHVDVWGVSKWSGEVVEQGRGMDCPKGNLG
jgi:hypothetical protein